MKVAVGQKCLTATRCLLSEIIRGLITCVSAVTGIPATV